MRIRVWFFMMTLGGVIFLLSGESGRGFSSSAASRASGGNSQIRYQDNPSGTNPGAGSGVSAKAFLDQKKLIGPGLEWNREVVLKVSGTISFRIDSQGPFSVLVLTEKGYKALLSDQPKKLTKEDVLLNIDSKGKMYEGKVKLPAGASYFIIGNQTNKQVEFRLQCFDK
jgi:hypothetical protein